MIAGCDCEDCLARKVGELVQYCVMLEEAMLQIKRLLDAGNTMLAYQLIQAAAVEAERRDLTGEVERMTMMEAMQTAADIRRAGRLH